MEKPKINPWEVEATFVATNVVKNVHVKDGIIKIELQPYVGVAAFTQRMTIMKSGEVIADGRA